jgi:hypothetical protein
VRTLPTIRELGTKDRSIAFFLFGLLLACYLLTYTGNIQSSDGLAMFATAENIVRRGEIDSNQLLWMENQQGNFGPDGELYSRKGLGMTLLAIPLVWLAMLWPAVGLVQVALLLNPLLTAWTGGLIFRTGRRLGWDRNTALFAALIFGLATLAWPYTQTFFSDPVSGAMLFGAFYGLLSYSQTGRKRYLLAGSLAWSLAYLTRVVNLATLPVYGFALIWAIVEANPSAARRGAPWLPWLRWFWKAHWRPIISFLMPVVLAGLFSLWWNWVRYGNPLDSGYVETESFSAVWWFGILGQLVGPARGLIWYSPILLLAVPGALWFWRHARPVFAFVAAVALIYILLYGKWYMWHGGYSWGPRFIVPLMPFLALWVAPVWLPHQGRTLRTFALLLAFVSILIQWLGMLVPFRLVQDWLDANVIPLFAPETFTQLRYSPLLLQWQYLTSEHIHLYWWRSEGSGLDQVDWFGLAMPLVGLLVGLGLLVQQLRNREPVAYVDSRRGWLYGAGLCIIAVAILTYVYSTKSPPELQQAARRLHQMEERYDAVLFLQPSRTQEFANVYHGNAPVYGLFPHGELSDRDAQWLDHFHQRYQRLWVLPTDAPPEQSGWERTLRADDFLLADTRVSGSSEQRIALYALSNAQPLQETGIGTIFGDPAMVEDGINSKNGWFRLNGYSLTPESHPGGMLLLALRWESLQTVDYDFHVFVHLLDAHGEKLAQRDGQPVQWMRPTSSWHPNEEIIDRYGLLLSHDLPTGSYTLAVGLYDPVTGQRLPVSAGPGDYAIELGPVLITPGS